VRSFEIAANQSFVPDRKGIRAGAKKPRNQETNQQALVRFLVSWHPLRPCTK
jgi:hypothetical protein